MTKIEVLNRIVNAILSVAESISILTSAIEKISELPTTTVVHFDRVVWLDATGEYVLIWYADGTGQVLHNEGRVKTLSTVAQHGKTLYKLSNGKELLFDHNISKSVYP